MVNTRTTPGVEYSGSASLSSTIGAPPAHPPPLDAEAAEFKRRERALRLQILEEELKQKTALTRQAEETGGPTENPGEKTQTTNPIILQVCTVLPGLSVNLFEKIYDGSFEPSNLCKFRINNGYTDDTQSQIVTMENGTFRLDAAKGKNKDFGNTIDIWQEGFINFITALMYFHGSKQVGLLPALNEFHLRVLDLARHYKWQDAALAFALDHQRKAGVDGYTNPEAWEIKETFLVRFCNPTSIKPALPTAHLPTRKRPRADTVCNNWNEGKCTYSPCNRPH
jgi:hypothetical protein